MFSSAARRGALRKTWVCYPGHQKSFNWKRAGPDFRRRLRLSHRHQLYSTVDGGSSTHLKETASSRTQQEKDLASMAESDARLESKTRSTAYPFSEIEYKWQQYWEEHKTFKTPRQIDTTKPKYYVLDMFPYPSGSGLHVGHPEGYTATDIIARFKRANGFNVLHPMGWDAFGLPAEQYALQTNTHPRVTTEKNINRFRQQLQSLGFSYDWEREISTTDPAYYKWTQWIFLKLFEKGLAYQSEVPVNWCPELGTVLANEEVIDGKSERGDHPVVRLPMKQWMLRITEYADRLLSDLDDLDWSESIKDMQRNWIGRSEGAEIQFKARSVSGELLDLRVFTTRPDTIFGATYMVLAPEHPLLGKLTTTDCSTAVEEYVEAASKKSDFERTELQKKKSGIFTGCYAINPLSVKEIPIWVADYVLGSYGSGAIMAVPGHDERDYEFAQTYDIPIVRVIERHTAESDDDLPYTGVGKCVNSSSETLSIDGLEIAKAKAAMIQWLEATGVGERKVNYKLRDWLFARQRYWGEPFPLLYPNGSEDPIAIPESDLPLILPDTDDFKPSSTPDSPLANVTDWVNVIDHQTMTSARRETSTMPQWAGSCWYYLRFIDPVNDQQLIDPDLENYWMPVDLYVGGTEHAVLHLLYARFWHKVLYDIGVVSTKEPFQRLVSQGMILGEVEYLVYRAADGRYVEEDSIGATAVKLSESEIVRQGSKFLLLSDPSVPVYSRSYKMSKSRGNVINPDSIVYQYGADSLRLYEMFMGPLTETKVWSTENVEGVHRFLARVYRLCQSDASDAEPNKNHLYILHTTIKKVTESTEGLRFNTAISAMMEFTNAATKWKEKPRSVLLKFVQLLAPYAPHLAEEMWQTLGQTASLSYHPWPQWDAVHLEVSNYELPVQINGKMRGTVTVSNGIDKDGALSVVLQSTIAERWMRGREIGKVIFVPERIINVVVK